MNEQTNEYNALVHCSLPVLKEGFDFFLEKLSIKVDVSYQDLSIDLMYKIKPNLDAIILLEDEADADFGLCHKVKMFSYDIPVLLIMPEAPVAYITYLKSMSGVFVLTSPFTVQEFCDVMGQIFQLNK